jgi:hypothetical protein
MGLYSRLLLEFFLRKEGVLEWINLGNILVRI